MWLGTKRMERIARVRIYSVSKPHKLYINRQYTNTVNIFAFGKIVLCEQSSVLYFQIEIVLLISCVMYIPYWWRMLCVGMCLITEHSEGVIY
jgi:hypothetical protein